MVLHISLGFRVSGLQGRVSVFKFRVSPDGSSWGIGVAAGGSALCGSWLSVVGWTTLEWIALST